MQTNTRLRQGDMVRVMSGRAKGKTGKVLRIDHVKARVYVEAVNTVKKHMRPTKKHPQGGMIDKEAPIQWSAVMLMCGKCAKPVRIKMVREKEIKKRVCVKCAQPIGN